MQLQRLLLDASGQRSGASERKQTRALANRLNWAAQREVISVGGVAKWFERGAIPGPWLMQIAALTTPPLNLSDYA